MIVTDTPLSGFTVINGTWGLHLGLFIGSIVCYATYSNDDFIIDPVPIFEVRPNFDFYRYLKGVRIELIVLHLVLVFTNFVMNSNRIRNLNVKYALTFAGMFAYIYVILEVNLILYLSSHPNDAKNLPTASILLWFIIETWTWFGIIISNALFLCIRAI